jgi:hypothetical protein
MNIILERVYRVCKTVQEEIPEITKFKKIMTLTRKVFRNQGFDIDLKSKRDKTLNNDGWYVMAYYDSDNDANKETPVEVIVYHNLDGTEEFGPRQVTLFLREIFDAVTHEYRHQYQSMRRDHREHTDKAPSSGPYAEYLADDDELDAYAFSIAIELLRIMDVQRARRNLSRISILSKMRTGPVYSSPTLRAYIDNFGLSPPTRKLAKKIYLHLETIDKRYVFM